MSDLYQTIAEWSGNMDDLQSVSLHQSGPWLIAPSSWLVVLLNAPHCLGLLPGTEGWGLLLLLLLVRVVFDDGSGAIPPLSAIGLFVGALISCVQRLHRLSLSP